MEELVNRLAELQDQVIELELGADAASIKIDAEIEYAELRVVELREQRRAVRLPNIAAAEELQTTIDDLRATILDEWDGDKKTIKYDAGTLKFRTTQSLKINDPTLVLTGLVDHTSIADVATKYISGFNKTAVKKYMGVIDLPIGAVELESKTTVRLVRIEEGWQDDN